MLGTHPRACSCAWFVVHFNRYRAKDAAGDDIIIVGQWAFNHTIDTVKNMWVADCTAAVAAGCNGCFIDRSNDLTVLNGSMPFSPEQSTMWGTYARSRVCTHQ